MSATSSQRFHSSSVMFIENVGQFADRARFQMWGGPAARRAVDLIPASSFTKFFERAGHSDEFTRPSSSGSSDHAGGSAIVTAGGFTQITAGGFHTCALTALGGVMCWGYNYAGQFGDGTEINRSRPVDVIGLNSDVTSVVAGGGYFSDVGYTCVITTSGSVKCWGDNRDGQLGDGTKVNRLTPVEVQGLASGVIAVAAGYNHTCALATTGGVKCWGDNRYGRLGMEQQ